MMNNNIKPTFLQTVINFMKKFKYIYTLQICCFIFIMQGFFTILPSIVNKIIGILSYTLIINLKFQQIIDIHGSLIKLKSKIIIYIIGLVIIRGIYLIYCWLKSYVTPKIVSCATIEAYDIVNNAPISSLNKYDDGLLNFYINSIGFTIQNFIDMFVFNISGIIISLCFTLIKMFLINKIIGLISLTGIVIYIFVLYCFAKYQVAPHGKLVDETTANTNSTINNFIHNKKLRYLYSFGNMLMTKVQSVVNDQYIQSFKLWNIDNYIHTYKETHFTIFFGITFFGMLYYLIISTRIMNSVAIKLIPYNISIIINCWFISNVIGPVFRAYASGNNIINTLNEIQQDTIANTQHNLISTKIESGITKIELIDVSCEYNGRTILKNVNLVINKNDIVLIKGPSGCGKTTLINIITGMNTHYTGVVNINDIDIKDISTQSIIDNYTYIMQGTNIIDDTILNNIVGDNLSYNQDKLTSLCKDFNIKDLNKSCGMFGNNLSGGEKQRVCIIRGLMKCQQGNCIISDELTSNLDYNNAMLAINTIANTAQNSILIMIEHITGIEHIATRKIEFILNEEDTHYVIKETL